MVLVNRYLTICANDWSEKFNNIVYNEFVEGCIPYAPPGSVTVRTLLQDISLGRPSCGRQTDRHILSLGHRFNLLDKSSLTISLNHLLEDKKKLSVMVLHNIFTDCVPQHVILKLKTFWK